MKFNKIISNLIIFLSVCSFLQCADVQVNYNNSVDPESDNYIPAAPITFIVTTISDTSISLVWNDDSYGENGYKIERKIGE